MAESFWSTLLEKLGLREPPPPPPPPRTAKPAPKPASKQVFAGKAGPAPAFAEGIDSSALITACEQNVVCEYTPSVEQQRIYSTGRRQMDGNLAIEYEGIAGCCAGTKNFGLEVARDEQMRQAYRYVDLNHIFTCCCGDPRRCPFYQRAVSEREDVEGQMRRLPDQDDDAPTEP